MVNLNELTDFELSERAIELGIVPDGPRSSLLSKITNILKERESSSSIQTGIKKKNKRRRKKKSVLNGVESHIEKDKDTIMQDDVEIEYVTEDLSLEFKEFEHVFAKFKPESLIEEDQVVEKTYQDEQVVQEELDALDSDDGMEQDQEIKNETVLGKKKLKKMNRLSVAELKQLVKKPEVVEVCFFINSKRFYTI